MKLKGFGKLTEKLPWFSGKKICLLPVFIVAVIAAGFAIIITFDSLPEWLLPYGLNNAALSFSPLLGELLIIVAGFLLVYQMWLRKDRFKAKYGELSYQRIILVGFTGIIFVILFAFSLFISFRSFSPSFWMQSPFQILAQPLESFVPVIAHIIFGVRMVLAVLLLIIGIGMVLRSLQTFGLDYMALVYMYFPEEGRLQEHEIYSVLRHPTYSGLIVICLGGMFFTFTTYSIMFFIIYLAGFYIHIYCVEEKELLLRFGKSFQEYRKNVPAFFVKPSSIKVLLVFLLKGPKSQPNPQ